ncbi:hypothetical protein A5810_002983, partial [Enterococcus faecium]
FKTYYVLKQYLKQIISCPKKATPLGE